MSNEPCLTAHSCAQRWRRLLAAVSACVAVFASAGGAAAPPDATPAALLHARHAALAERLADNVFRRPLLLVSAESASELKGDVYALVDHPYPEVKAALGDSAQWCDMLILHLNTKLCRASPGAGGTTLAVSIGTKHEQPLSESYRVDFAYRLAVATPAYLDVRLDAANGPLGTTDYRIRLQAVPVAGGRTFLHFAYSYSFGLVGRLAMQAYLATAGRDKLGFTVTGTQANGEPEHIRGVRGVVERNTMRYFLAVDAYLGAVAAPAAERPELRLQAWFSAAELYPRQLHEVERAAYVAMKRDEYRRQQSHP